MFNINKGLGFNKRRVDGMLLNNLGIDAHQAEGLCHKWGLNRQIHDATLGGPKGIMDTDTGIFFGRTLEVFKNYVYNRLYPEFRGPYLVPVSTEVDTGADAITAESYDMVGLAPEINNEADDYGMVEITKQEQTLHVATFGAYAQYSLQELRRSMLAARGNLHGGSSRSLAERKSAAAVKSIQLTNENILAEGHKGKLEGFYNHSQLTKRTTAGGNTLRDWSANGTTTDQIIEDFTNIVTDFATNTKDVHQPNTVLCTIKTMNILLSRRIQNTSKTLLHYLQNEAYPHLKLDFVSYARLNDGAGDGVSRLMIYEKDPLNMTQEMPQPIEIFAPQQIGTGFKVFVRQRYAGVALWRPLSVGLYELPFA